ncbi:hypothetical protein NESM_000431000 [Novymonas esmeraldas]|uniref:Uncharacterized protein n=1 Tax=Novymonas esmeraldas TaxID=1808958 RepID=A0AAW0EQ17_9TRYP
MPHNTGEKQRRPSPRAESVDKASTSPSYPSGQESGNTPGTGGSSDSGAAVGGHRGARQPPAATAASARAVAAGRTPPYHSSISGGGRRGGPEGGGAAAAPRDRAAFASSPEYGRAMAQLLDSVASPLSTSASRTPPRSAASTPGYGASHLPAHRTHDSQRHQPSPSHTDAAPAAAAATATETRRHAGESTEWGHRTPPQRQQQHHRDSHDRPATQRSPPPPAHTPHQRGSAGPRAAAAAATVHASAISEDTASSTSQYTSTPLEDSRERHGSDWASPAEVLQLRTLCRDVVARHQREMQLLRAELAKAQEECAAYARERATVLELRHAYEDGVAARAKATEREAQWTEERALLRVQMESVVVENERLQLTVAKQQQQQQQRRIASHPHQTPTRGGGGGAAGRDRVRAAVQAVALAASTAASASSQSPSASWPPSADPVTTTTTTGSLAAPQSRGALASSATNAPDAAAAAASSAALTVAPPAEATSPYAFLSSVSSSPPPEALRGTERDATRTSAAAPNEGPPHRRLLAAASGPLPSASSAAQPQEASTLLDSPSGTGEDSGADGEVGGPGSVQPQRRGVTLLGDDLHNSSLMTPSLSTSSGTAPSRGAGNPAAQHMRRQQLQSSHPGAVDAAEEAVDTGEAEQDPSYARGATDVSSTSGVSSSPSPVTAIRAMMLAGSGLVQVGDRREAHHHHHHHHHPMHGGGPDRQDHDATEAAVSASAASRAAKAPKDPLSPSPTAPTAGAAAGAGAAGAAAAGAAATGTSTTSPATTATTPSLGSTAVTGSSTASGWSVQYLYQLPRTPAEALQEELRMLGELRRLREEHHTLVAELNHVRAAGEMDTSRREQQHLRLAQAHEQARQRAAEWELEARQLEAEVLRLTRQVADSQDALESALREGRRQHQQSQTRLAELEASCRASLVCTRDELAVTVGVLRCSLREAATRHASSTSSAAASSAASSAELHREAEERQRTLSRVQEELHSVRAAHAELQDTHSAMQAAALMARAQLESEVAQSCDKLAAAARDRQLAESRIDELEAEVERLRAAAIASEGCMQAMDERLRLATGELAAQQEQLDEASAWHARALGAEEELATQRGIYDREIGIYREATRALQDRHHAERQELMKRYERLQVRYEATKMRLTAAMSKFGAAAVLDTTPDSRRSRHDSAGGRARPTTTQDNTAGGNTPNTACASSPPAAIVTSGESSPDTTAAVTVYDSLHALRVSATVAERLLRSLNRTASPYR